MNKTLKGIGYTASVAALVFGAVMIPGGSVFAEDACEITNGAVNINGTTLCVMDPTVNTINFEGTIEELHAMLFAFSNNTGYGYNAGSEINAKITTAVSMGNLHAISAATPTGAKVTITPTADFVWDMALNTSMPAGYSVNWDNLIVHLPENTTEKEALGIYNQLNKDTITVAVNGSSLTVKRSARYGTVVHLPEGTPISDAYGLANEVNKTTTAVFSSGMDYWIQAGDGKTTVSVLSEDALKAALGVEGLNEVHVNLDITVETINIPAGKSVIEDGAVLTIKNLNESSIEGEFAVWKESYTSMDTSTAAGLTASVEFGTALEADRLATLKIEAEDDATLKLTKGGELYGAFDLSVVDRNGTKIAVSDNTLSVGIGISAEDYEALEAYDELWMVYFNDAGDEVERMPAELIADNGAYAIEFETTHLSVYGVVGVNTPATAPETGAMTAAGASIVNTGAITLSVMVALVTMAATATVITKRNR